MSHGRTVWWPKDSAWWRRENIVTLGEEFGAAGPAVLDWLSCEAKSQNDGGRVKAGIRSCARGCFVDHVTVGHVLSRAGRIGALDDLQLEDGRFSCRISGWAKDNERGGAAFRKQAQREKPGACHGESRDVTVIPARGQERRGQERTTSSLRSDERAEADEWPDGLTGELLQLAPLIAETLRRVAAGKGSKPIKLAALGRVLLDFPDHDHRKLVGEFEHYWLHGAGERTKRSDIVLTYRRRLENVVARSSSNGGLSAVERILQYGQEDDVIEGSEA